MKKNKTMRMASALLVLTLLTTCIISGTFAKYTTADSASATARVAKWGVTVKTEGIGLFATSYQGTDNSTVVEAATTTVQGSEGSSSTTTQDNVVAPGTSGTLVSSTAEGTPEVAVKVSYAGSELTLTGWEINGSEYCPIIIKVNGVEYKMGTTANAESHVYATIETFKTAVETAINETSVEYGPNQDLSKAQNLLSVSWRWNFEAEADDTYQTNTKDTGLGNLATAPTITLSVKTTVEQIKERSSSTTTSDLSQGGGEITN